MPQLNPAPWFFIFFITWTITLMLLKPMTVLQDPVTPVKNMLPHPPQNWPWL